MHLLIPAAGMGKRMGSDCNKLRLQALGRPLLAWTILAAQAAQEISWIGIIGQQIDFPTWQEVIPQLQLTKPVEFIAGGATRQESVHNGLKALPADADRVLIHDGARCLATPELLDRCAQALNNDAGLIAAVPVKDTIKIVNQGGLVAGTPDRATLWAAQTPQGFPVHKLKECHGIAQEHHWQVTDDAALFERFELPVHIVPGEDTNLKITTPADLEIAELILRQRYPA
ncbi:2-C-methyl-D-erythritol 4-phosphate cytidylyltransferase [Candidatus Synechococcus calcipolaris G9]|uniref:2-C-methyl-D-erythritol 4-phosphate cytidylyltransferase n=1 Tax=Candidatus Synechococcus calcipolaris G9 TaxID=1497997 RepID=A0ABT6EWR5_9SYNE|nr:2-C-methyl-D-erythritol 4-phosphate cytidylyltransferase [Candidatus Synechococcus calcipolaris]MDG2990206.1 2-C-methyl-D-erythritol 4-phosphate cytidylyltransferase [Candidatus Synechococcus calcipolaris G9]